MKKTVEFKQKNATFCPVFGATQYPEWVIDHGHISDKEVDPFHTMAEMNKHRIIHFVSTPDRSQGPRFR
jgi:hypothetical protein